MALLIEKNVTVLGDIDLSQLYLRLGIKHGPEKSPLKVSVYPYSSKAAYNDNMTKNAFYVEGIDFEYSFSYDSSINGEPLIYIHNKLKEVLSSDATRIQEVLDPSTSLPLVDPSTGESIMEEVITRPKFAMDSSISIVDLD